LIANKRRNCLCLFSPPKLIHTPFLQWGFQRNLIRNEVEGHTRDARRNGAVLRVDVSLLHVAYCRLSFRFAAFDLLTI